MNRYRQLRKAVRVDLATAANKAGIDEIQLALFEQGIGWIHIGAALGLCDVIQTPASEVFPLLADVFSATSAMESEDERQAAIFAPENRQILLESGIDPDIRPWFAIVRLKSGNERRYFLTSMEYERIRRVLVNAESSEGFLTFHSDCQNVILRIAAIASIRFCNDASYAYFASHERDFVITVVSDVSPRPVTMVVAADGGPDGEGPRPFSMMLASARGELVVEKGGSNPEVGGLPPFISVFDQGYSEAIVSFDGIEVIEIPCGVVMPDLYDDEDEVEPGRPSKEEFRKMEAMGEA